MTSIKGSKMQPGREWLDTRTIVDRKAMATKNALDRRLGRLENSGRKG